MDARSSSAEATSCAATTESDSDSENFYDCSTDSGVVLRTKANSGGGIRSVSNCEIKVANGGGGHLFTFNGDSKDDDIDTLSEWGRRLRLPSTMISRNDFSIWSFLKQCIGKELSKITMPISFNEPLSFLQRVVEYAEYYQLLIQASLSDDPIERHELVVAFAVSATASNWERTGKPFNPLLGETYELDRSDLGWRVVCEQVSHHPPSSAFHVESSQFTFHGCIHPKLKFWGSSVQVTPKGLVTLCLHRHNEVYTWQNINCCVRNVIIGKIWIEHFGEMEVINHMTKWRAVLQFKPTGWMGGDPHKVQGYLYDKHKNKIRAFYGKWIEAMYSVDPAVWSAYSSSSSSFSSSSASSNNDNSYSDSPALSRSKSVSTAPSDEPPPDRGPSCDAQLTGQKLLWVAKPKPSNTSKYYNFTSFAMMLNEFDPVVGNICPTDCRLRPDMRLMEAGQAEEAAAEKSRLEEKQRASKKDRRKSHGDFKPRWFRLGTNRYTGAEEYLCNGEYWKRDWSNVDDIY